MQIKTARGVQLEDVWAAADALIEEGAKPTIEKVRLKMGRGSPNTVGPMLDAWFATLGNRLSNQNTNKEALLPIKVQELALNLWDEASKQAQTEAKNAFLLQTEQLRLEKLELEAQKQAFYQQEQLTREKIKFLELQLQQSQDINQQNSMAIQVLEKNLSAEQTKNQLLDQQKYDLTVNLQSQRLVYDENIKQQQIERQQLTEQFANNEKRWLLELDRSRQEINSLKKQSTELDRTFQKEKQDLQLKVNLKQESLESEIAQSLQIKQNLINSIRLIEELKRDLAKQKSNNLQLQIKIRQTSQMDTAVSQTLSKKQIKTPSYTQPNTPIKKNRFSNNLKQKPRNRLSIRKIFTKHTI